MIGGAAVWRKTAAGSSAGDNLVLPDGCMDLIWMHGDLIIAGPDTVAHAGGAVPGTYTGIRFAPGVGPAVFGLPAVELRDRRVPLADVWGAREARVWTERVADAAAPGRVLEQIAARRLRATAPDPVAEVVAAGLARGEAVADLAARVGLSTRQLQRRSIAAFGYGAKTLGRVLRLSRALELARGGEPFAGVAARAGYADQAHLAREVRSLAGVPLTALIRT